MLKSFRLRKIGTQTRSRISFRKELRNGLLLFIGTTLAAFGYAAFQVPNNLAAGGLTGISLIVNNFTGWPVGLLYWVLNLPLLILGFRLLGRWPFLIRTLIAVTLFSVLTDLFIYALPVILPVFPISDDLLLMTVYGGIVGGIGGGLIYRSGSTMGGTGIIGRILQQRTGQPLSQVYFYTDGFILLSMGLVFGWEVTLYGLLMLFLNGLASDFTLEGPSSTRVATIVTDKPQELAEALMAELQRGASYWEITGSYTGRTHFMLMCTMYRSQVQNVKTIVSEIDPDAFVTIGVSHRAMGKGFTPL